MPNTPARKRILVVDDEPDLTDYLTLLLKKRTGHDVRSAPNASAALVQLHAEAFELVITDIHMPGMSGTSLLREIKQFDPNIEVILLTGQGSLSSAVESLKLQAFDYIDKPVDAERMVLAVRNALTRQGLAVELSRTIEQVAALNRDLKRRVREEIGAQAARERLATASVLVDHLQREAGQALDALVMALGAAQAAGPLPAPLSGAPDALIKVRAAIQGLADSLARREGERRHGDLVALVRDQSRETASVFPWIELELALPETPREALIDRGALAHAVRILVENGVQAMDGRGRLAVSARDRDGRLEVSVRDQGPGFTRDALEALERPFMSPGSGTGLGLLVVRRVVQQHGGTLAMSNADGGGGLVTLSLPVTSR